MTRQEIKAGLASSFIRFPVILGCRTLTEYGLAAKPTVVVERASTEPPLADQHDDLAADDAGKNRTPGSDEACESARPHPHQQFGTLVNAAAEPKSEHPPDLVRQETGDQQHQQLIPVAQETAEQIAPGTRRGMTAIKCHPAKRRRRIRVAQRLREMKQETSCPGRAWSSARRA